MDTPALAITRLAGELPSLLEGHDALTRLKLLDAATESVSVLRVDIGTLRAQAMADYVSEVGATAAAREFGISRGRVYQMLERRDSD